MQKVIYIDVFIVTNMLIDCVLLKAAAAVLSVRLSKLRLLLGSLAAAAASLVILLPPLKSFWAIMLKIVLSALICSVAFGMKSPASFFSSVAAFVFVNFVFGGAVYAFTGLFSAEVVINNMSFYFESTPLYLVAVVTAAYLVISAGCALWKNRLPEKTSVELKLSLNRKIVALCAFVDTGHKLVDAVSGRTVLIVNRDRLKEALTPEQSRLLDEIGTGEVSYSPSARFRLIPYSTLGGDGNLVAFACDYCDVTQNKKRGRIDSPLVAVTQSGDFEAIIPYDAVKGLMGNI